RCSSRPRADALHLDDMRPRPDRSGVNARTQPRYVRNRTQSAEVRGFGRLVRRPRVLLWRSAGGRAPSRLDFRESQLLFAMIADDHAFGWTVARLVHEPDGSDAPAQHPTLGPLMQSKRRQVQSAAHLGEPVLVAGRIQLVGL